MYIIVYYICYDIATVIIGFQSSVIKIVTAMLNNYDFNNNKTDKVIKLLVRSY